MRIKHEWTIVLCGPSHWSWKPRWAWHKETWPRVFQFHWLFFYCHRIETPE